METLSSHGDNDGAHDSMEARGESLTPTEWLRAEIARSTNQDPSLITDGDLLGRYKRYGHAEWEPTVADDVRQYLIKAGFRID